MFNLHPLEMDYFRQIILNIYDWCTRWKCDPHFLINYFRGLFATLLSNPPGTVIALYTKSTKDEIFKLHPIQDHGSLLTARIIFNIRIESILFHRLNSTELIAAESTDNNNWLSTSAHKKMKYSSIQDGSLLTHQMLSLMRGSTTFFFSLLSSRYEKQNGTTSSGSTWKSFSSPCDIDFEPPPCTTPRNRTLAFRSVYERHYAP